LGPGGQPNQHQSHETGFYDVSFQAISMQHM
jgi:hypothetical protein